MTNTKQHDNDTKELQAQVRGFYEKKKKIKIYHGTTNSTRSVKFEKGAFVDVSKFNKILSVNTTEGWVLVEPNVPMDKLVEETMKYGLVPPVVPEFPGITIGGAIQGGAEESSSFKYGMVHDCCLEYEIILGNGQLITVSREKHPDLFWGTAASYGSLGIITLVKLRLVPAKEFVELSYHPVKSFGEAINFIKEKSREEVAFIDGIMFSKNRGVIMTGNFTDKKDRRVSTFHKASDEWFYLHAEKIREKHTELIPTKEYFFRYDRGAFWMGQYDFKVLHLPFNRFTRFLFNIFFNTRTLFRIIHETGFSQKYFIQDFNLPSKTTLEFLEFADKELGVYPLWICPLKPGKEDRLSANCIETDLVFNLGIWGETREELVDAIGVNRTFEQTTHSYGGRKMLYAHQYYSPDEFWQTYDEAWYNHLRTTYRARDTFPTIYEKTLVSEKYKPSILRGIFNFLKSPTRVRIS